MSATEQFAWLAEVIRDGEPAGLYATGERPATDVAQITADPWVARWWVSREACQQWCDEHPKPPFKPVEHGFLDPPGSRRVVR